MIVSALNSCTDTPDNISDSSPPAAEPVAENTQQDAAAVISGNEAKAKIGEYAFDDLTDTSQFPSLNKQLGKKGVKDAMAGSRAAAYRAAKNADCDKVETAAPSDSPDHKFKDNPLFFVSCSNLKQWRFSAKELKDSHGKWYTDDNAPAAGLSDSEVRKAEHDALQASAPGSVMECSEALKHNLKFPASATLHDIAGASMDFNDRDEHFVNIELEAKNDYGNELTYTGQCIFHRDGTITVQFFNR